jgi:hypothetical protein
MSEALTSKINEEVKTHENEKRAKEIEKKLSPANPLPVRPSYVFKKFL